MNFKIYMKNQKTKLKDEPQITKFNEALRI